jgi:hypothetical protein
MKIALLRIDNAQRMGEIDYAYPATLHGTSEPDHTQLDALTSACRLPIAFPSRMPIHSQGRDQLKINSEFVAHFSDSES